MPMDNGVYKTEKETLIKGYKLSPAEKKMKKNRQDKFNKKRKGKKNGKK